MKERGRSHLSTSVALVRCLAALLTFLHVSIDLANSQSLSTNTYDVGNPTLTEFYVDGTNGDDSNNGLSALSALRTIDEAWRKVPQGVILSSSGYRINIVGGFYPESSLPNYWESRYGTYAAPVIFRPLPGTTPVVLGGDVNLFDSRYIYFVDLNIIPAPAGDAFHCERCDHILIRRSVLSGGAREAHETLKVNQSQYIYIEDSDIFGADDNAIDFVAVQYGHIVRNRIHDAGDWCAYVKGGSAYLLAEGNEIYDCGTGGFTAGQGTGFEFMTSPWLHYEAYDIKFVNNIIHDTEGAAFGVNGGYNILLAHNTAFQVGARSHLVEIVFGNRSCDGDAGACAARRAAGGWGPSQPEGDSDDKSVPNKNVFVLNNIIYNPAGYPAPEQIFAIYGPRTNRAGLGLPTVAVADDNLQIRGNIIWSLNALGVAVGAGEDGQGCLGSNPTCNPAQLISDNALNTILPTLKNPGGAGTERDLRPTDTSSIFSVSGAALGAFPGGDRPATPVSQAGELSNLLVVDRGGEPRPQSSPVAGAYVSASSRRDPIPGTPGSGGGGGSNPPGDGDQTAPTIIKAKAPKSAKVGKKISIEATVRDNVGVASVTAIIGNDMFVLARKGKPSKGTFKGSFRVTTAGVFDVVITAVDQSANASQTIARRITIKSRRR